MNSHKYFENTECKYYPCHETEEINCLFCYCPLYFIKCCGKYSYINNIKDCSKCTITHDKKSGWKVVQKYLGLHTKSL